MSKQLVRQVLTWEEFVAAADTPSPEDANSSRRSGRDDWYGATWKGALDMARGAGYRDALPEVEELSRQVEETVAAQLFQTTFQSTWDVAGAEVDMGRFLSGEPECMIESTPIRLSRHGRAVRIAVPSAVDHRVKAETILARGAAVMALVDILARAQHPLEIWSVAALASNRGQAYRASYSVLVQESAQPLDPGRVMFALAHPAMQRRLIFSLRESEPQRIRERFATANHANYGIPTGALEADLPEADGTTIVLPMLTHQERWDAERAVEWVKEQVALIFD